MRRLLTGFQAPVAGQPNQLNGRAHQQMGVYSFR
jgi:hypothetical protein